MVDDSSSRSEGAAVQDGNRSRKPGGLGKNQGRGSTPPPSARFRRISPYDLDAIAEMNWRLKYGR